MTAPPTTRPHKENHVHRRTFLKFLATATATATTGFWLAGCSDNGNNANGGDPTDSGATGEAVLKTLRVAATGGPGEEVDPSKALQTATWAAIYAVFEPLVIHTESDARYQLADTVESNDDATEWTVTIREGATFSDGSPVTAGDVMKSVTFTTRDPMKAAIVEDIDTEASTIVDARTVTLRLARPRADFIESVLGMASLVFKDGDPGTGIGSGPYVLGAGDSAQGWTLDANPHFPADRRVSETLEIQVITDPAARTRALESGAVDMALNLPPTAARTLDESMVWIPGPYDSRPLVVVLNTRVAPFDDPEVRHAVKIAIDREELVAQALDGAGEPGADVPGLGFADYPEKLTPPKRDVGKAAAIFAEKGISELTLFTADLVPGMNDGADLIARQLGDAGVTVTVDKRDPVSYYADVPALQELPMFASYLVNRSVLASLTFITGSRAVFNLSGFGTDREWDEKLSATLAETDESERRRMLTTLATTVSQEGGDLIWAFANSVNGLGEGGPPVPVSYSVPVFTA
nr:ABC transporter substrate-binding protein [Corynebacterium antarcticum]